MTANKLPHFGADITDRELDVLKGMSYGLGNAQIGWTVEYVGAS